MNEPLSSFWTETSWISSADARDVDQKMMLFKIYFSKKLQKAKKSRKL